MWVGYDYHLSYEEAEQRLGVKRPSQQLTHNRLHSIGHALRSEDIVLREVLTFLPEGGARRRSRPRLRFYDTLKADLAERNIVLLAHSQDEFWRLLHEKTADRRRSSSGDAKMDATSSIIYAGLSLRNRGGNGFPFP